MQILGQIGSVGVFTKCIKYSTFYTVITFILILSTGQTVALAHMLNGLNDVFPHKEVPFGVRIKGDAIGGNVSHRTS